MADCLVTANVVIQMPSGSMSLELWQLTFSVHDLHAVFV